MDIVTEASDTSTVASALLRYLAPVLLGTITFLLRDLGAFIFRYVLMTKLAIGITSITFIGVLVSPELVVWIVVGATLLFTVLRIVLMLFRAVPPYAVTVLGFTSIDEPNGKLKCDSDCSLFNARVLEHLRGAIQGQRLLNFVPLRVEDRRLPSFILRFLDSEQFVRLIERFGRKGVASVGGLCSRDASIQSVVISSSQRDLVTLQDTLDVVSRFPSLLEGRTFQYSEASGALSSALAGLITVSFVESIAANGHWNHALLISADSRRMIDSSIDRFRQRGNQYATIANYLSDQAMPLVARADSFALIEGNRLGDATAVLYESIKMNPLWPYTSEADYHHAYGGNYARDFLLTELMEEFGHDLETMERLLPHRQRESNFWVFLEAIRRDDRANQDWNQITRTWISELTDLYPDSPVVLMHCGDLIRIASLKSTEEGRETPQAIYEAVQYYEKATQVDPSFTVASVRAAGAALPLSFLEQDPENQFRETFARYSNAYRQFMQAYVPYGLLEGSSESGTK